MRKVFISCGALAVCLLMAAMASAQGTQTPQTLVINVDRANLRDKATVTGSAVVATLTRGEQLDVLEKETAGWYRVRVKRTGQTGYVSNTVVQVAPAGTPAAAPPAARPAATPPPAAPPAAAPNTPAVPRATPPPAAAPPAAAPQTARPQRPPSVSTHKVGFRAYGLAEGESLLATKSFEAVLGSGKAMTQNMGFGVEVTDLWKGVFVRFSYSQSKVEPASRVFVDTSNVPHSLNIPLKIQINPLEIGGGWRFNHSSQGSVTVTPFAGAAILMQQYKETSDFSAGDENVDETDKGSTVFGGAELGFRAVKVLKVGFEAGYRNVPDKLGAAGTSAIYNEKNLGGVYFRLTFGVGF